MTTGTTGRCSAARVCAVDGRRRLPDHREQVCQPCESYLGRLLDELSRLWTILLERTRISEEPPPPWLAFQIDPETREPYPVPGHEPIAARLPSGPTRRRIDPPIGGSREAPLPVNLDLIDLIAPADPRALTVPACPDQTGYLPVATELDFWVKDWAGHLDQDLPTVDVWSLAAWLRERLAWACAEHHAIDEFAADVKRITAAVRAKADETDDRQVIGVCPAIVDDHACRAPLRADPFLDIIECPHCSTRWPRRNWLMLALFARQENADAEDETPDTDPAVQSGSQETADR